jgi:multiple sugar transport system substrate-binding protein
MMTHLRKYPALVAGTAIIALALTACGGSGFEDPAEPTGENTSTDAGEDAGPAKLTVMIGSSGDAETDAVQAALDAWNNESGNTAELVVASDLNQQLSQGFAASTPPDVFYASTDLLGGYAANGTLEPYGDKLSNKSDFYPSLVENFSVDGTFYCAPKDFSTLALIINEDAWAEAGLSDSDIPTDWASLEAAARTLTTDDQVGLSFGPEYQRLGVFMAQAGGTLTNADGTEATVDSPENIKAIEFVQSMLSEGILKYPSAIDTGWGGEAFGSGRAAMTIEGNWITGALKNDYPDLKYKVVELPAGDAGKGTLQFTNCWGIASDSQTKDAAISLVEFLTETDQQLKFSEAFGPMPSVASAQDGFAELYPEQQAFVTSADFASGMPTYPGTGDVIGDFNAQLEGLATANAENLLKSFDENLQAIIDEQN